MLNRKNQNKSQAHDSISKKNTVNSASPSTRSSFPSNKKTQTKRKSAWLDAPLPKFYDREMAAIMVKLGYYSTIEDAFQEVSESRLNTIKQRVEEYLLATRPPISWVTAPLPSPKK